MNQIYNFGGSYVTKSQEHKLTSQNTCSIFKLTGSFRNICEEQLTCRCATQEYYLIKTGNSYMNETSDRSSNYGIEHTYKKLFSSTG